LTLSCPDDTLTPETAEPSGSSGARQERSLHIPGVTRNGRRSLSKRLPDARRSIDPPPSGTEQEPTVDRGGPRWIVGFARGSKAQVKGRRRPDRHVRRVGDLDGKPSSPPRHTRMPGSTVIPTKISCARLELASSLMTAPATEARSHGGRAVADCVGDVVAVGRRPRPRPLPLVTAVQGEDPMRWPSLPSSAIGDRVICNVGGCFL